MDPKQAERDMPSNPFEPLSFIRPVAPDIYLAEGPNEGRFPHCNAFVLLGDRTVLIDTGIGERRIREIDRQQRIDSLIISHSHPDHLRAWHALADRELWVPAQTPASVHDLSQLGLRFTGSPEDAAYWADLARHTYGLRPLRSPDHRFADDQRLDIGNLCLKAIHLPGHLDDHYGFLETRTGTLFSTDIDFTGFGPWYGNPESDLPAFINSIDMLRRLSFRQICSSHKPPIGQDTADAAFDAYLAALDRQKTAVVDLCRQTMDLDAMVAASPFYGNRMPDPVLQRIFETRMIRALLRLLMAEGRVRQTPLGYRSAT